MVINIKVEGLDKSTGKIQETIEKLTNLQSFFSSVGEYMKRRTVKECFEKEQSPDGIAWKPIKRDGKILSDTGELKKSVQYEAKKDSVILGSKLKYSRIHQFGGKIKVTPKMRALLHWKGIHLRQTTQFVTIPARPYLGVTKDDKIHIVKMFTAYLKHHNLGGG